MSLKSLLRSQPMLAALKHKPFRWFFMGRILSSGCMQMGGVAQGWLVYELTGSGFALGWVGSGWAIATLVLSLFGGTLSDRSEKRRILIWMRGLQIAISVVQVVLIMTDAIQVWHLAAASLTSGICFSFMMPAQNALLYELVDRETLLNAVSLSSVGMGLMGIVAAWAAGFAIDALGIDAAYVFMTLLHLGVLLTLFGLPKSYSQGKARHSAWSDLVAGVRYLRIEPLLIPLVLLVFVRGALGMPYRSMMPKFAQDVMGYSAEGLGGLTSAVSVGGLVTSLALASLGDYRRKGRLLLLGGITMGLAIVAFANWPREGVVHAFLVIVGVAGTNCMVLNQTLLQEASADEYRGRVMSMYMMAFGLAQLCTMPIGALADLLGVQTVLSVAGLAMAAIFGWVLLRKRNVRQLA